jgi:16S rRNA (cytidine1402-2'-O)-methyltransferase
VNDGRKRIGRLVLCPTPLGNLEDITLRALRELRECDVIFAEDTRVTQKLLRHFDISKPLRSFHERSEGRRTRELRALLSSGQTVAVVTDAGMPGISDPGSGLVGAARELGAKIDALPGANAALGALVLSGFDIARFRFGGFVPRQDSQRRRLLQSIADETNAVVLYEAPSRIIALLDDLAHAFPTRRVFLLREYTKMFEQQEVGTARQLQERVARPPRGEFTLVIEGAPARQQAATPVHDAVRDAIARLLTRGASVAAAVEGMRLATGLPRNALYKIAQRVKEKATS